MTIRRSLALMIVAAVLAVSTVPPSLTAQAGSSPLHARSQRRLLIRNAMVIYGSARPPYGPVDIILEDGVISSIGAASRAVPSADAVIDAHRQVRHAGHRQYPHALA